LFQEKIYQILLQNENGPCPLLAAANVLLLKQSITLPPSCKGAGVVTIEELTNVLAEKILLNHHAANNDHHINEVMKIFPNLQFGMDVNPKFTAGPTGIEYTMELNAFDLLSIELVHGWLLEPDAQEFEWVGNNTYNQLVNIVIEGNDASAALQQNPNVDNLEELSHQATKGSVIHHFLERSGHQLTQYGLQVLHEHVKEGDMVVFFRNNHFNTLTKYEEHLYLLVTDFGYADVASVVWEKLDVIDGDTEYVDGKFKVPPPVEHTYRPQQRQNNWWPIIYKPIVITNWLCN
jgi:ubiquitin carboxyl-terminal hydrolase MINDY-1/2